MNLKKIIFASKNKGKAEEIKKLFKNNELDIDILTLNDLENPPEIVEDGKTFLENAFIKASTIFNKYKLPVLADDSGIVVEELGEPGVLSARYAGKGATDDENNRKLLEKTKNLSNKKAYFECALVYINQKGEIFKTSEKCFGEIIDIPRGEKGFGYDPIFYIPELNKTLAEIDVEIKNKISHRGKAFRKFINYISKENL